MSAMIPISLHNNRSTFNLNRQGLQYVFLNRWTR